MTLAWVLKLALQSVTAPREAARYLLGLKLDREALLTAFLLVAVLNTLVFSATVMTVQTNDLTQQVFSSPSVFLGLFALALGATTAALFGVGRVFGGAGSLSEVATLMIWLQVLRFLAQVGLALLSPFGAGLSSLLVMLVSGAGLWILLHFVDEVHGFGSLGKSAITLVASVIALGVFLTLVLSLMGVGTNGLT